MVSGVRSELRPGHYGGHRLETTGRCWAHQICRHHCSLRCHLPSGRFDTQISIIRVIIPCLEFQEDSKVDMVPSIHWLARAVSRNRRGYLCVLGSFLLSLALSLDYSYPNLNTYIVSYLRQNGYKSIVLAPPSLYECMTIPHSATTPRYPTRTSSS